MDKNSKNYLRSEFKSEIYGNENYTTCEKELRIFGNDKQYVDSSTGWIKSAVMP